MGRAAFLAVALALGACASKPPVVFGARMPAGCKQDSKSERCVGWMFDRILMTTMFKPYDDAGIHDYIASVGARLARANHDTRRWTFRVLDDNDPQAYAGFNSVIYITRGALAIMRDESELAAAIGHEMGHTIAGHHRGNIADMTRDVGETELQKWRDLRYARDDEIQADEQAVVFLARAGYDVHAVERILRALGGYTNDDDEDATDDRHPVWRERIARAAALAASYPDGERGHERYNAHVAKLVIGDDPRTVAIVDSTVMFARAGVAVDLPPTTISVVLGGMVMFVLPDKVVGTAQLIDRNLAKDLNSTSNANIHTEIKAVGSSVLSITIVKGENVPHPEAIARSIIAASRAPRPDEVARLHPMRFDPTKPRAIWSR